MAPVGLAPPLVHWRHFCSQRKHHGRSEGCKASTCRIKDSYGGSLIKAGSTGARRVFLYGTGVLMSLQSRRCEMSCRTSVLGEVLLSRETAGGVSLGCLKGFLCSAAPAPHGPSLPSRLLASLTSQLQATSREPTPTSLGPSECSFFGAVLPLTFTASTHRGCNAHLLS